MSRRPSFRNLSIRSKLTVLSMTASATALLLACAAFVTYDLVTFRETMVRRLVSQSEMIGYNSAAAILFHDEEAARKTLEALRAEGQVVSATIYTKDGKPFASYRRDPGRSRRVDEPLPAAPAYGHRFAGEYLSLLRPIVFDDDPIGSVGIRSEVQEVSERAWRYLGIALLVLLVSLGVAFAISAWPRRVILEPILHLSEVAAVVSREKDYSIRARRHGDDELGLLVDTFNEMLSHIQKRAEELQEARDAALESSRLKTAFLANMSHEIRTPLNVILGYNSLIADYFEERRDGSQKELLDAIQRGSQRLTETIDGILDISRIETGTFELKAIPLELAPILERHVHDLEPDARENELSLSCRIEEHGAVIVFDPYCLSGALSHLLSNAVKFTEKGEVMVRLHRDPGGALAIEVRDTGIGIDPGYLAKLFEPFSQEQVGYTRKFEGPGLGLALTRRYLELNGASISVETRKGGGSVFTVHFSRDSEIRAFVTPAEEDGGPAATATSAEVPERRTLPGALVVEDHADTRAYLAMALAGEYRVFEASSAEEVRAQLAAQGAEIRIILLDLSLCGDEDGLTITRELRSHPKWASIPIVATTAHAFLEDRARALSAGCDGFLAKPINRHALLAVMAGVLRKQRRAPEETRTT